MYQETSKLRGKEEREQESAKKNDSQRSDNRTAHVKRSAVQEPCKSAEGHPAGHMLSKEKLLAALVQVQVCVNYI